MSYNTEALGLCLKVYLRLTFKSVSLVHNFIPKPFIISSYEFQSFIEPES